MTESTRMWRVDRGRVSTAVVDYAAFGLQMVPLFGVVQDGSGRWRCECSDPDCGTQGKHPRWKGWQKSASANPDKIAGWLNKYSHANVGVATGAGVVVLDFDPRGGSDESEARLNDRQEPWPDTPEVATGGGGRHLYFSSDGWYVGNALPALKGYPGIDVRGRGGLVVAPPSRHISGTTYEWVKPPNAGLAPMPRFLTGGLVADLKAEDPPEGCNAYGWTVLADEYAAVATAVISRNDTLFKGACRVFSLVEGGHLDDDIAAVYLAEAGELAGLPSREALSTLQSARKRASSEPRKIPAAIQSREDAHARLREIRQAAMSCPWRGHAGKRQLAVLEALIRCAMRAGGPGNFAKGIRGIALEAGISSLDTVMAALRELEEAGWVRKLYVGTSRERPSRWKLRIPPELQNLNEDTHPLNQGDVPVMQHPQFPVGHDAFRRQASGEWNDWLGRCNYHLGLDKTAWRILELLQVGRLPTRRAVAARLGVHPSTVGRHVKTLIAHHLVVETGDGLQIAEGIRSRLDNATLKLRTAGAAESQRDRYGWSTGPNGYPELEPCPHRPHCVEDPQPSCSTDRSA